MITNLVFSSEDFRKMDEGCGIDAGILMENAAKAVFERIRSEELAPPYVIACGKGNNGGDGWCLACLMHQSGLDVTVLKVQEPKSPLTVYWAEEYTSMGGAVSDGIGILADAASVIDCVFGFSFRGSLREDMVPMIEAINACGAQVLSVDVPSGMDCDMPETSGLCVRADCTATFTGLKRAQAISPYREMCGKIFIEDIGIPKEIIESFEPLGL